MTTQVDRELATEFLEATYPFVEKMVRQQVAKELAAISRALPRAHERAVLAAALTIRENTHAVQWRDEKREQR